MPTRTRVPGVGTVRFARRRTPTSNRLWNGISIRQTERRTGEGTIRWMNVPCYLKSRKDKTSRQIVFTGERLDMQVVWKLRDRFYPPRYSG